MSASSAGQLAGKNTWRGSSPGRMGPGKNWRLTWIRRGFIRYYAAPLFLACPAKWSSWGTRACVLLYFVVGIRHGFAREVSLTPRGLHVLLHGVATGQHKHGKRWRQNVLQPPRVIREQNKTIPRSVENAGATNENPYRSWSHSRRDDTLPSRRTSYEATIPQHQQKYEITNTCKELWF